MRTITQRRCMTMSFQEDFNKLADKIRQYRDEAKVQMHLAGQEVKDEWDDLEQDWEKFRNRLNNILHDAEETSQEARDHARKLGEDLREGYEKIRNRLK
jgi:uncharacterized coiled-coil DUF342 family protein